MRFIVNYTRKGIKYGDCSLTGRTSPCEGDGQGSSPAVTQKRIILHIYY